MRLRWEGALVHLNNDDAKKDGKLVREVVHKGGLQVHRSAGRPTGGPQVHKGGLYR